MRVLVVDDDPGLRQSLSLLLAAEGYEVAAEGSSVAGLDRALAETFDLILCDVRMPELDGREFLRRYRAQGGRGLLIIMSAYGGDDAAIGAMKEGAYDYLPKPFRADEVLLTLRKAEERERLRGRVEALEAEVARLTERDLVAESAPMRRVLEVARRVAPHATTVLITGESGTGKEVLARTIHRLSPRRDRPFVAVNCGAIPETLLESELFGHRRGAFTGATADRAGLFEEAHQGSILLDEVGELPAPLQVKLLRSLQEGEIRRVGDTQVRKIDVRVLAATARDLEADVNAGAFREDLFYRLNVVRLHIPPLRERMEDLDRLVPVILERQGARMGLRVTLTPAGFAALRAHRWPGNVRELENALERAAVLSPDGVIDAQSLDLRGAPSLEPEPEGVAGALTDLRSVVRVAEREALARALDAAGGNRRRAAQLLGISVRALFYKLKDHGLSEQ